MGTPTLFGDSDELTIPKTPAPLWLVKELVALGVKEETAAGYSMRQAYGVKAKLECVGDTKVARSKSRSAPVLKPGLAEPLGLCGSLPERWAVISALEEVLADHDRGHATADEMYRTLRASLYVCSPTECVRVAKGLILLLRGE
ncbi:MAG: hypothetical protein C0467_06025 [Planctomycetaceae bacterium]|nr:hypothetical protein [Planctomycetaceae bacterium]